MRMPEPGRLGETFFDASDRAMVSASFVKRPLGGNVETVFTDATQRLLERDLDRDFACEVDLRELRPAMRTSQAWDAGLGDGVA
jgi:hypothetical protein